MDRHGKKRHIAEQKKKRIIVFDFYSKMMIKTIKGLQARGVEIVYWADGKREFMDEVSGRRDLFPNTIFHSADDAIAGVPAREIDISMFEPLGSDFIKQFLECELRSLVMMDTIDLTAVTLMKKIHLYNEYLKYWYGVFQTLKPDAIVFYDAPHMAYKHVAHCVAKHLNIRQIILRNTQIGGRLLLVDDTVDFKKIRAKIEDHKGKDFTLDDLNLDVRDYYEKQQRIDRYPFYVRTDNIKKRTYRMSRFLPSGDVIKKNLRNLTFLKTTYLYARMLLMKRSMPSIEPFKRFVWAIKLQEKRWQATRDGFKREYAEHQTQPDYSKKYIYVTLHNQPEASTSSDGDVFVDQILMIDTLSYVLPDDWVIYVKESPLQWYYPRTHKGRFKGYTEEIVRKKNVYVVPTETSTFDLIKNSQAVAAVTGSAVWEAVLRGKPGMVFGYTWYMYCDGVLRVKDFE